MTTPGTPGAPPGSPGPQGLPGPPGQPGSAAIASGWAPVPDPTLLTTALVDKAMQAEEKRVEGLLDTLRERLRGMDRATELNLLELARIPEVIDEKVHNAAALTAAETEALRRELGVELVRIAQQFTERDTRAERESRDNKVAVDAAFAAQKEAAAKQDESNAKAIDKSEKATAETIGKLSELFDTSNRGLRDKIEEVARRIERIEAGAQGTATGRQTTQADSTRIQTTIFAVLGVLFTVLLVAIAVVGIVLAQK